MGGTGGLGSDRSSAQTGLQGAGLLSGTEAPSATMASLGVEDVPQPSSGLLSGGDSALPVTTGPRSASDTPMPMPPPIRSDFLPNGSGLVQAPPTSGGFELAGPSYIGLPPTLTIDVKPPTTPDVPPPITGGITTDVKPPSPPTTPEQLWDEWYKAHPGTGYTIGLEDFLAYDLGETRDPYSGVGANFPERGSWEAPGPARTPEEARVRARQARQLGQPTYDPRITSG